MRNKKYLLEFLIIILLPCFFNSNIYAQSNTCAGAPLLDVLPNCANPSYSITFPAFTPSGETISCGGLDATNTVRDGWFSFQGNGNDVTIEATTNRNLVLAVYSGACGALVEENCTNAGGGNNQTEILTVPTINGDIYFVRLTRRGNNLAATNSMDGNICLSSPPANDECTGAFDLNVGQFECTFGEITNTGGTYSNTFGGDPSCTAAGAQDVWYKFVAPAGGQVVIDTQAGSITDAVMELYHAPDGTCGSLASVDCDDDGGAGTMPRILEYNLTGGDTYYLRVWEFGGGEGTLDICVQNQYSDCDVSLPLCSSSSFNTNSFGEGNTDTNVGNCFTGSDNTERQSVWVNFEIQTSGDLQFIISPQVDSDDYDFILYRDEGSFCTNINANGTVVSCNYSDDVSPGDTGANGGSSNSQNAGGTNINADIPVLAGERYFLLINNFENSSSGFDLDFTGTAGLDCVVLPLELTEFRGEKIKDQNLLHWATAREFNTSHFEIERSNDAMDFINIGELKCGNKKNENQIYQYWDKEPQIGINYYRLKQVDLDGTFTYTKTISIDNQGIITNFEIHKIYPNPAQNAINFVFAVPASNSELQIEIFDNNGESVVATTENYQKGIQNFNQNLSSFVKGLYILRISNLKTGQVLTEKFVKK
ncbi:T9SS type A sorting domain-containing protein [Bernardetia sp. Wsw4-3y2]|uniref:T9SS type A sorting domain-containing protein n=1 Tax=Bernardetia sp. Wsw4-3y2 TaxID=3127471 RepID=UPI0030D3E7A4